MEKNNREGLESKGAIWIRVIFFNIFVVIAITFIGIKSWWNPLSGIQGMGDLTGFVALLVFIYTTWKELAMLFYDAWTKRERQEGRQEGRQEAHQELLERFDQIFADDKDAMKKRDMLFNSITSTNTTNRK